jgi:hypothetical protein
MKVRAAACLYAALLLALGAFASSALAGDNGHGHGGGQSKHDSSQAQTTTTTTTSSDNSTGVKPSSQTNSNPGHDTHAPASSNKTKQYGNGKTAGQIATTAGYGNSTLHGPGNSQPHKVNCGGHEVDVHALKHKKCGATEGAKHEEHSVTPATPKTPAAAKPQHADHKVTICHATGSATNPYVEITVDYHALKNGHTAAKGDIIPAPAGGCPKPAPAPAAPAAVQSVATTEKCTETKVIDKVVVLGVKHFIGPKGSGRFVIIHPNPHSSHYRDKHPDELITETIPTTVTVASACPSTTTTETTTTVAAATAPAPPAPSAPAPAAPTPAPAAPAPAPAATAAGGVLGAITPLHSAAKPKATGGVLGSIVSLGKKSSGSTLPFTGLPLWIFALVAAGLILVGAVARRAGSEV